MSGKFLDDLGRVLATPMPRSQALRLIGATLFVALFPRPARALTCAKQGCPTGTTDPCCIDFDLKQGIATAAACCNANQHCCKTTTPPHVPTVHCCWLTQSCITDASGVAACMDCPNGQNGCGSTCCPTGQACVGGVCCSSSMVCGSVCLQPGQTCLNGTPCPSREVCGSVCLEPGQTCLKVGGQACPSSQACGKVCCPTGMSCFAFGVCRKCPTKQICGNGCCPPGTTCKRVPSRIAPSGHVCVRTLH